MKLKLDTERKTIEFEENINLEDLFKRIKVLLPRDLWKEFTLVVHNFPIVWIEPNPIIVPYPYIPYPDPYPTYPWITWGPNTGDPLPNKDWTVSCNSGKFEIIM